MRKEWEEAHVVAEELVEGPPSRRANATLTACPNGSHLWCIGGEFFSEDGRAVCPTEYLIYRPVNLTMLNSSISIMMYLDIPQRKTNGVNLFLQLVQALDLPMP